MKIHHSRAHGESIAGTTVTCKNCDSQFQKAPCRADRVDEHYCSEDCFIEDRKATRDQLIQELQRLREELGRTPTQSDLSRHGQYSRTPYEKEFGNGWNQALREAGMSVNRPHQSEQNCLSDIRETADKIGGVPTVTDQRERGCVSVSHITRVFGSWRNAVSEAGLDETELRDYGIPDSELISDIKEVAENLDKTPTKADVDKHGKFAAVTAKKRFGSFSNALREAGLEPNRKKPVQVSCSHCSDAIERYEYHVNRSEELFCNEGCFYRWLRDGNAPAGQEHHQFKPEARTRADYGPSWPSQRQRALERDDHTCQRCGMGSKKHRVKYGMSLHVHHVVPWHEFDDHKERNDLSNLLTLCASCHAEYEQLPVKPQIPPEQTAGRGAD
jgi:hypothetical protein